MSPFFNKMVNSPELLEHLSQVCGEPVLPHMYLYNIGHVNVGKINGDVVDQWHFDSVPYVCITLLSDVENMVGGELELVVAPKEKAIDMIIDGTYTDTDLVRVNYDKMGKCIMAQVSGVHELYYESYYES